MEKDFAWLCTVLCTAAARVSVPETLFCSKGCVFLWVFTSKDGIISRKNQTDEVISTTSSAIQYFSQVQMTSSPIICTALVKGLHLPITSDRLEEAMSLKSIFSRCSYLQQSISRQSLPIIYTLKLESQGENVYQTSFTVYRVSERECMDQRLYCKLIVYGKVVLRAVECVRKRRVEELGLEFGVGDEGEVWLVGSQTCRLGTGIGEEKCRGKVKKGFPRLNTPAQFHSQQLSSLPLATEPSASDQSPIGFLPLMTARSFRQSTAKRPLNFYDSNFKEILGRTWARSKKVLSHDHEGMFLDLDACLMKEDESKIRLKRMSTILRHSDVSIFQEKTTERDRKLTVDTGKCPFGVRSESRLLTSEDSSPVKPTPKRRKRRPAQSMSTLQKLLGPYVYHQPCLSLHPLLPRHRKAHSSTSYYPGHTTGRKVKRTLG